MVLADVPPPPTKNDKVGFQVKVTLWFWLMYPPPQNWNKHECYRKQLGSASTFYQSTPPSLHTYISSLWNTLKRKPLFFKFSWNFGSTWQCGSGWCTPSPPQTSWILSDLQLFQCFPTEVAQNDSEWPIMPDLQLFQSFPTKVAQNGQFHPIYNFSNLFPLKWLRMTWNGQFCLISNFSNVFPPKWLRMTWNG